MLEVDRAIDGFDWEKAGLVKPEVRLNGQPADESRPALLWDGEWEITWVTFRDMGGAFMVRSEERRVGKSVSVRVDLGGRRLLKKKQTHRVQHNSHTRIDL